jgi:hypothetical protein
MHSNIVRLAMKQYYGNVVGVRGRTISQFILVAKQLQQIFPV